MSKEDPTLEELRLLRSLASTCDQFMPSSWTYLDHGYLTAGQDAVAMLDEYGLVVKDGCGGSWTTKAIIIRENDGITEENFAQIKSAYLDEPAAKFLVNP